jgi:hypothetical protein
MGGFARAVVEGSAKGDLIIPRLRTFLYDPDFESFVVKMRGFEYRGPDGWFHPSTHPLWSERQLYFYLARPDDLVREPYDPLRVMAVTRGHFWHSFIEHCLLGAGVITAGETYVEDAETGAHGGIDGRGDWDGIYELKTMKPMRLRLITDVYVYGEKHPEYWAQAQEYMRMTGMHHHRTLLLSTEYPFEMKEFRIPFDPQYAEVMRAKYLRVRQAVADQVLPPACCGAPKTCIARSLCPTALEA